MFLLRAGVLGLFLNKPTAEQHETTKKRKCYCKSWKTPLSVKGRKDLGDGKAASFFK